uniref:Uncharacterized protein n=1 Tax=Chloropicon primus TaxID=1764295 RepID=A0A7S2X1M0_9CHLO
MSTAASDQSTIESKGTLSWDSSGLRKGFVINIVFASTAEYVLCSASLSLARQLCTRSPIPAGVIQPYAMWLSVNVGLPTSESSKRSFRGAQRTMRCSRPDAVSPDLD